MVAVAPLFSDNSNQQQTHVATQFHGKDSRSCALYHKLVKWVVVVCDIANDLHIHQCTLLFFITAASEGRKRSWHKSKACTV
jgi:hypothetical protein